MPWRRAPVHLRLQIARRLPELGQLWMKGDDIHIDYVQFSGCVLKRNTEMFYGTLEWGCRIWWNGDVASSKTYITRMIFQASREYTNLHKQKHNASVAQSWVKWDGWARRLEDDESEFDNVGSSVIHEKSWLRETFLWDLLDFDVAYDEMDGNSTWRWEYEDWIRGVESMRFPWTGALKIGPEEWCDYAGADRLKVVLNYIMYISSGYGILLALALFPNPITCPSSENWVSPEIIRNKNNFPRIDC